MPAAEGLSNNPFVLSLSKDYRLDDGPSPRDSPDARTPPAPTPSLRDPPLYYLRNTTAGLFAGDSLDVRIEARSGARVQVASSSATKAFATPAGSASMRTTLVAEPGSLLVWGPHATILQAGASYTQTTDVLLHAGAIVLAAEVLALGRLASGERNAFRRFENDLSVRDDRGRLLYAERYVIGEARDLSTSLAGRGAVGSVYALGAGVEAGEALEASGALSGEALAGWSLLPNGAGLVVRMLAASLSEGQAFVERCLRLLVWVLRRLQATPT